MSGDRGSVSVEVAMLTPAFLLLVALAAVTGRTAIAQNAIDLAAHDAARAASISRTAGTARRAGEAAAVDTLRAQGLACVPRVTVDTSGFATPVGSPAAVRVVVDCVVSFTDLALPGVPGSRELSADFTSPIDRYRGRR
jgi:Flp pilus assembly protein TadG